MSIATVLGGSVWSAAIASTDSVPSGLQFVGVGADGSTLVSSVTSQLVLFDSSTVHLIEAASGFKNVAAQKQANLRVVQNRGSGLQGINGSGLQGINGSGLQGINGSGLQGINGSGLQGINGSGLQGINGSGLQGINGSGLQGINGSGLQGINGSGLQGINGSGLQGINGSGLQGINGSGLQGIAAASTDSSRMFKQRANLIAIGAVSSRSPRKDNIAILGQTISINAETQILAHRSSALGLEPTDRSSIDQGAFVVVLGDVSNNGQLVATDVILLPALYSDGNTPVYLRGYLAAAPSSRGEIQIGNARINIASASASDRSIDLVAGSLVEIFGRTCGSNPKASTPMCITASSSALIN